MRILITGGAGFIGSHLQDRLIKERHTVAVLDNLSSGKRANLNPKAKFFKADVRKRDEIKTAFRTFKPQAIYHVAGQVDVQFSLHDPREDAEINILGMIEVLQASVNAGIKHFVYSHSGGASYGDLPRSHLPAKETSSSATPISPYGISKSTSENYLQFYGNLYAIHWVSLRYANVYGPRQTGSKESGVVPIFITNIMKKKRPIIYGNGSSTRDYTFVDDVVDANLTALHSSQNGMFNISTGKATSTNALLKKISQLMQSSLAPVYKPARNEIRHSYLSPVLAKKKLGWNPKHTLESGLRKTILWHRTEKGKIL